MQRQVSIAQLEELLGKLRGKSQDDVFTGVSDNSARCGRGDLFVACTGERHDGHEFLSQAQAAGVAVAVVEKESSVPDGLPYFVVQDCREALATLAAIFLGNPSAEIPVIGITGTNGKTTVHILVDALLREFGLSPLRVGTLGATGPGLTSKAEGLTTPGTLDLFRLLADSWASGAKSLVMEASSHALEQKRVHGLHYDVGIFTNLTQDHLDYHEDMESYFQAKRKLAELLVRTAEKKSSRELAKTFPTTFLVCLDDEYGKRLVEEFAPKLKVKSYGFAQEADLKVEVLQQDFTGMSLMFQNGDKRYEVQTKLVGGFNAQNLAAALLAMEGLGFSFDEILPHVSKLEPVVGRLESLGNERNGVFVDYAHTPDALKHALVTLRELCHDGKLWVVFGCGGDRDRGKRPQMAKIAEELADEVVVTSDNPRTEDPEQILDDILASGISHRLREVDRAKAIYQSLSGLEEGDVLLIAGKGHEQYQILGTEKVYFSDQDEVKKFFGEQSSANSNKSL